ncbi:MAG: tRNA preQ1(34) S-adenosylmethionine ribosyltransferase-isomerase QueA, partial [Treponema sp.]|nr:tRNA preQ1(34) S-adenosylmethionine ribosyltransferase-isomerase QueA [Treponema sp.]
MKTNDFYFDLPEHLIAQFPSKERGLSRLMTLNRATSERTHSYVNDLPDILCKECFLSPSGEKPLLVFNDTKVRKARLVGKSVDTGAAVEFLLLEKNLDDNLNEEWKTIVQHAKRRKPGSRYIFYDDNRQNIAEAIITKALDEFRYLQFEKNIDDEFFDKYGHIPLPPYIKRKDETIDSERYQTIYANKTGSAAAPTAGLHFTQELLDKLDEKGIERLFVTLHVGLGTFLPVRSENIKDHKMHKETYFINEQTAIKIQYAKEAGRKIIAVGTTSVRTLESAWDNINNGFKNREGDTS